MNVDDFTADFTVDIELEYALDIWYERYTELVGYPPTDTEVALFKFDFMRFHRMCGTFESPFYLE